MTGYANAVAQPPKAEDGSPPAQAAVSVELRSVNGRFLDFSLRMPDELRALEPQLRELVSAAFKRGKIEMRINTQRDGDAGWPQPQPEQLNRLANLEAKVRSWLPSAAPLSVHEALNWCRGAGATLPGLDAATLEAARDCVRGLAEAREREGEKLVNVLLERIARLRELALEAEPLLPAVVARQQQRFLERWQEALNSTGAASSVPQEALQERALNEAAAFAIRIDVAEELARLRAHLDELTRLLKKGGELGKRLDFLIQELHREANTLGSKSAALELTNISVEMKVAIEQMREQVQNLE
ncbi:MAG: YicC family protein [Roseateles depolymerans]|uniref:YicC family protein n=1 Tax=Roseateles depolymerans TaxID=76731 RepID=A0A2W5FFR6_9BURK|nr:MAG: YicC family protein [Roseateles depolymerans]